jgi:hypothetical protein
MPEWAGKAREVVAGLSPQDRETNRVQILTVELLADMADSLDALVEQGQARQAPVRETTRTDTAGTRRGAGRSAAITGTDDGVDQDGGQQMKVRTTEPETPPADLDDQHDQRDAPKPGPPPAKKAAPVKKAGRAGRG